MGLRFSAYLPLENGFMSEILLAHGYNTYMAGNAGFLTHRPLAFTGTLKE